MATYTATTINDDVFSGQDNCAGIIAGSVNVSTTVATGDILRFARIPAGFKVHMIVIQNADLGTSCPADFGYNYSDGSSGDDDNAFLDDAALGTANAAGLVTILATPVIVEKDSYLEATVGTVSSGATGVVTAQLHGVYLGAK